MTTLSIIIPTKNEEDHLPSLLTSIKSQSLQPVDVIIADALSTDRTRQIAHQFDCVIVDGGLPGPGRNAGARVATGDVLLFLDADVQIHDNTFFERVMEEVEQRQLDVATTDLAPYDGNVFDKFGHDVYNRYVRFVAKWRGHANGSFILARRSLHERIHGFDETVVFCEDHDYAHRGSRVGKYGILNTVTIGVSTRRMKRDGRFTIAIKSILGELHMIVIGPIRHHGFRYTFGYKK